MHSRSPTRSPPKVRRASLPAMPSSSAAPTYSACSNTSASAAGSGNSNSSNNHVRVIVRIRPMNQEEAKSSRVCVYAEKVEQQQQPSSSTPVSVVGNLLGRLKSPVTATAATPPPLWALEHHPEEEGDLDHGMILDSNNNHRNLSPHYNTNITPLRPITVNTPPQQPLQLQQQPHFSKTVVVETSQLVRRFSLDQVLPPTATQQDVYASVVAGGCGGGFCNVKSTIFRGYNATILAYGQTASGKTYTMMGNTTTTNSDTTTIGDGVIPRAIHDIMMEKQQKQQQQQAVTVKLSCMEIYQDELRDLLVDDQSKSDLKLRDAPSMRTKTPQGGGGVQVRGLTTIKVDSLAQVLSLLSQAQDRRRTGSTRLNERSSRSHMITTLTVVVTHNNSSNNNNNNSSSSNNNSSYTANKSQQQPLTAKLTLVDLAGSERIKQTQVVGASLGESIHINTDLFTLGKVVNALCEKSSHVPYRDSKLTRLLKDALGGNCSTTLICCVSPSELYLEESVNTLRYAERSRSITNSLQQNVLVNGQKAASPFEVAELRAENKRLKTQVVQLQRILKSTTSTTTAATSSDTTAAQQQQLESLMHKMKQAEALGRAARESSRMVSQQADKWHEQVEQKLVLVKQQQQQEDTPPVDIGCPLSYELTLIRDDEDSLIDESDNDDDSSETSSLFSLDSTTKTKSFQVEVKALSKEKVSLKAILLELSNQIEAKREDLEQLDEGYKQRRQELAKEHERQEKERDALALEIAQMKLRLQESNGSLRGLLLRGRGSNNNHDGSDTSGEVEQRSLKKVETESLVLARDLAKSLAEERTRGEELHVKCQELEQHAQDVEKENLVLVGRNQVLQDELQQLLGRKEGSSGEQKSGQLLLAVEKSAPALETGVDGKLTSVPDEPSCATTVSPSPTSNEEGGGEVARCESSEREGPHNEMVKSKVQQILRSAGNAALGTTCGSTVSSFGTELLPGTTTDENESPQSGDTKFFISNIEDANKCTCEASMFASNAEHVEFYLPLLGVSCTCGKQPKFFAEGKPYALECILRPWQVEFLKSVGISDAIEFIHAFTHRGITLATQMRKWRRQKCLLSVKTKSCRVALHIWHRTCKSVVRHVRQQQAQGVTHPERPDFLEIPLSDNNTMSTLGGGSAYNPNKPQQLQEQQQSHNYWNIIEL